MSRPRSSPASARTRPAATTARVKRAPAHRPATVAKKGAERKSASLAADARALHDALSALVRLLQHRDRDRICCHDISVSQCYALEEVLNRGPITLGDLAEVLYLDKSTASRVVGGLVEKAYVRRREHPGDARAIQLEATAKGRTVHARIERDLLAEVEALLTPVGGTVRREMVNLVARLARAVAARDGLSCACGETGD